MNYEEYSKTFDGKTFEDEWKDVEVIFKHFLNLRRIKINNVVLVGFSLGGTMGSFLVKKYPQIRSIFMFGSGVSTKRKMLPILSTYPKKEKILKNFSKYKGSVYLIQGENDDVVPQTDAREIINHADKAIIKEIIVLKNVDHQFNLKKGIKKIFLKNLIVDILKNCLQVEENYLKSKF